MDSVISVVSYIFENFAQLLTALIAVGSSLIGLFMLIPGDQPEKALQGIVNFLSHFSKK